jgi:hypothetical protein
MRSSGSSWSLILSAAEYQEIEKGGIRTLQRDRVGRGNASIRGWVLAPAMTQGVKDAWKKRKRMDVGRIREMVRSAHCGKIFDTKGPLDELDYHPKLATLASVFWDIDAEGCCLCLRVFWCDSGVVILGGKDVIPFHG